MALAGIPPWEAVGPLDFLQAAQGGARLGIERAGQTLGAEEAANRLGLSYAQLASENARASAAQQAEQQRAAAADALRRSEMQTSLGQWMQEMELRRQQAGALDQYRGGELASRNLRDALALATAKQRLNPAAAPEPQMRTYTLPDGTQLPYLVDVKTGAAHFPPSGLIPRKTDQTGLTPRFIAERKLRILDKQKSDINKYLDSNDGMLKLRKAEANPTGPEAKEIQGYKDKLKQIDAEANSLLAVPSPATSGGDNAANTLAAPAPSPTSDPLGILTSTNAPAQ